MTISKAAVAVFPLLLAAACEREPAAPPPAPDAPAAAAQRPPEPWFICDALNGPTVLVAGRPDAAGESTILTIDKADQHPPVARRYAVGAAVGEGNGQSRPLTADGEAAGRVLSLDPARMAEGRNAATEPVVEVTLDGQTLSCRWLLRTRLFGVAAGRTVLVTDETEGPMLRTFDFKGPVGGRTLPDGAQRSSQPTLRIEAGRREGERFVFANEGYGYTVDAAGVSITQDGQATSAEPFIALQHGRD